MSHQRLVKALEFHKNGDFFAAEQSYLLCLQENPLNLDALNLLGCLYGQSGDYAKAFEVQSRAFELSPENFLVAMNLANTCRLSGNLTKAISLYDVFFEKVRTDQHLMFLYLYCLYHAERNSTRLFLSKQQTQDGSQVNFQTEIVSQESENNSQNCMVHAKKNFLCVPCPSIKNSDSEALASKSYVATYIQVFEEFVLSFGKDRILFLSQNSDLVWSCEPQPNGLSDGSFQECQQSHTHVSEFCKASEITCVVVYIQFLERVCRYSDALQ